MAHGKTIEYGYEQVELSIGELFIDDSYQREIMSSHVKNISCDLDGKLFHPIAVSKRPNAVEDGDEEAAESAAQPRAGYAVIDGQHRYYAALANHITGKVRVMLYEGLTYKQEVALFQEFQEKRKNLSPYDSYKAGLAEEREDCLLVAKITQKHGYRVVSKGCSDGELGAVATLRKIVAAKKKSNDFPYGEDLLDNILETVSSAWGTRSCEGTTMAALARLLTNHKAGDFDRAKLVDRLRREGATGLQYIAQKKDCGSMNGGGGREMALYRAILSAYNKGEPKSKHLQPYYA